jgi:hypothetical protein
MGVDVLIRGLRVMGSGMTQFEDDAPCCLRAAR